MKKLTLSAVSLLLLCGTMAAHPNSHPATSEDLVIQVSPQRIVIGRDTDVGNVWLTIHAEISYSAVGSVVLVNGPNEFELSYTKSDNRGELVAKFDYEQFKSLSPGEATLTLTVIDSDGVERVGSETIWVMVRK
jgi:hypothetical protein